MARKTACRSDELRAGRSWPVGLLASPQRPRQLFVMPPRPLARPAPSTNTRNDRPVRRSSIPVPPTTTIQTRDLFPQIGDRLIASVTSPDLLAAFRKIEFRCAGDTAPRAHGCCGQVFRHAIATGRTKRDSARGATHSRPMQPICVRPAPCGRERCRDVKVAGVSRAVDLHKLRSP
jgi:hypothetical protein